MSFEGKQRTLFLVAVGFALNFIMGVAGSIFPPESLLQMMCWQIGDTMALMACVLSARYLSDRNFVFSSDGFNVLAIAYGVSFASSSLNAVNEDVMASVALPLVPALCIIGTCALFPMWLRIVTAAAGIPFLFIYKNVIQETYHHDNPSNAIAYIGLQTLGLLWTYYFYLDNRKTKLA
ncbi:MAG: hypothetical protein KBF37_05340 [Saprospiraceae bacterium]|jgi:hypothetical protein|nr:hypothetical protein [Saprospiraceae bacterium]MBP9209733.1 hypothetical protein [Saprospiraceae bacterium]MBV6474092.1 hypothetical protein [Saprospiraceae bacterium]